MIHNVFFVFCQFSEKKILNKNTKFFLYKKKKHKQLYYKKKNFKKCLSIAAFVAQVVEKLRLIILKVNFIKKTTLIVSVELAKPAVPALELQRSMTVPFLPIADPPMSSALPPTTPFLLFANKRKPELSVS